MKCQCKAGCTYCHFTGTIQPPDKSAFETIRSVLEDCRILRKLLWLNHSCTQSLLYGDDGEMQCAFCMIDFKRDGVKDIEKRFNVIGMERMRKELLMPENEYYTGNKVWAVVVWLPNVTGNMRVVGAAHSRLAAEQEADALTKHHPDKSFKFGVLDPWE